MNTLVRNSLGGITYATQQRMDNEEHRSVILAELRMTIDVLSETCDAHINARANIDKLAAMLAPGATTDELKAQIERDMEKLDAVAKFRDHVIEQVRNGSLKRMAELFDR